MLRFARVFLKALVTMIVLGLLLLVFFGRRVNAQEPEAMVGHPPQDMAIHDKFYNTWMMPKNRQVSCCHKKDCSPAEAYLGKDGLWMARKTGPGHEEDGFVQVPAEDVEHDRDNPDGRNHLCSHEYGPTPTTPGMSKGSTVYCFIAGEGS